MVYGGLFLGSRIQKKSYPPYNIHRERWCIPKNPNVTHLGKEHFLDLAVAKSLQSTRTVTDADDADDDADDDDVLTTC